MYPHYSPALVCGNCLLPDLGCSVLGTGGLWRYWRDGLTCDPLEVAGSADRDPWAAVGGRRQAEDHGDESRGRSRGRRCAYPRRRPCRKRGPDAANWAPGGADVELCDIAADCSRRASRPRAVPGRWSQVCTAAEARYHDTTQMSGIEGS